MRKITFVASILGIFILFLLSAFLPPTPLSSLSSLNKTINNQKVIVSGKVIEERVYSSYSFLKLNNSIPLHCNCKHLSFKNKKISVLGTINEFPLGNKYIKVLKIKEEK
ncbi:hypothetical protein HYW75_06080 [Candidatus Pacearchaeota archaeon]|nr:hypothetical protein [Candidatus Pacearchaeota archaeon]